MEYKFSAGALERFCFNLLNGAGVSSDDARVVSSVLVDTNLDGIDTHGISRLPVYIKCLRSGRINSTPQPEFNKTAPSLALLDGDNGLGQLLAVRAMEKAMEIAKEQGAGIILAHNSNHFGAASYYCKMAANNDMLGMVFTNSPPAIAPWGGKKPYLGTNPIALGCPGGEKPVIVDLSSSHVARGNIISAARENRSIPENWAMDSEGNPTSNAAEALEGSLLPLGGAKGYALAFAVEILCGIITGASFGAHVGWIYDDSPEPANVGHFFAAVNIEDIMNREEFVSRVEQMKFEIEKIPRSKDCERIFIPGERKNIKRQYRLQEGIPLSSVLLKQLNGIAFSLGVEGLK